MLTILRSVLLLTILSIICDKTNQIGETDVEPIEMYSLIRILSKSDRENRLLIENRRQFRIDFWSPPNKFLTPFIASFDPTTGQFLKFLSENHIEYEFLGNFSTVGPKFFEGMLGKDSEYYSLEEIKEELDRLKGIHSDIMTVESMGKTAENRDIWIVKLRSMSTKTVVIECGIHAREWVSVSFCMHVLNTLVTSRDLLDRYRGYQFLLIPTLNPDGLHYSWTSDRLWRYNRKDSGKIDKKGKKCIGIDLNRNFLTERWCQIESSDDPCYDFPIYCGEHSFSAEETMALNNYLTPIKNSLFVYISIHSFGQLLMYPYGYTTNPVPNSDILHKLAKIGVEAIEKPYGTKYKYGSIGDVIYRASGGSDDWAYDTLGIKYAFTLELRPTEGDISGFKLAEELVKPTVEEAWMGIKAILEYMATARDVPEVDCQSTNDTSIDTGLGIQLCYPQILSHHRRCVNELWNSPSVTSPNSSTSV